MTREAEADAANYNQPFTNYTLLVLTTLNIITLSSPPGSLIKTSGTKPTYSQPLGLAVFSPPPSLPSTNATLSARSASTASQSPTLRIGPRLDPDTRHPPAHSHTNQLTHHRNHGPNRNLNQHPATPRRRPRRLLRHPLVLQQTPRLFRSRQQQQHCRLLTQQPRRRPRPNHPSQRHVPAARPPQHSLGPAPQRRQRSRHLGADPHR